MKTAIVIFLTCSIVGIIIPLAIFYLVAGYKCKRPKIFGENKKQRTEFDENYLG